MFGDNNSSIDNETIELLENAQSRIRQKKNVYRHFIFYLFISGFFLFVDLVLAVGENLLIFNYSWSIWVLLIWTFILLYHLFDVFISKSTTAPSIATYNGKLVHNIKNSF